MQYYKCHIGTQKTNTMTYLNRMAVLASLIVIIFASCEKNGPAVNKLSVTPTDLFFTKAASSEVLKLETNADDWYVVMDETLDWISVDKKSGSGNADITVSVTANPGEERACVVKVGAVGFKTAVINVTQKAVEELINPSAIGLFAVPELPDADSPCSLYYRADAKSPFYNYNKDLYAHIGIVEAARMFVQAE